MTRKPRGTYDWVSFKTEWLGSNESLEDFRKRKGVSSPWFWRKVGREKWGELKDKLNTEAIHKLEQKVVNGTVDRWANQIKLWRAVEARAAQALNDPSKSIPKDSSEITLSIDRALKAQKLILGEPTGDATTINQNLFLGIQALIAHNNQQSQNGQGNPHHNGQKTNGKADNFSDLDIIEEL